MDLATLVTEGMKLIGRGDLVPEGSSLDNHSTISLSLGEQQVIHIAVVDEYPVIWTPLQTDLPALRPEVKGGLLDILTEEPAPLFYRAHRRCGRQITVRSWSDVSVTMLSAARNLLCRRWISLSASVSSVTH